MSSDFLKDRKKSLEDEFFHKESEKNLEQLRAQLAVKTTKEELRLASGMADDAVLDKLVALGLSAETVMALSLVPLIQVAWSDGKVQPNERQAILQGAQKKGIEPGSAPFKLLEEWLSHEPGKVLFETWESYVEALGDQLNRKEIEQLEAQVTRFARFVAESAGGFLGIGKISDGEEDTLRRIKDVFENVQAKSDSDS